MNNKAHLRPKDFDSNGDIIPMSWKEEAEKPQDEIREFDKKFADLIVFNDQSQRQLKSLDVHEDI